jgi:hypothetical protein
MLCHPDGITTDPESGARALFEAKHTNAFEDENVVAERYYAQLQHNMEVLSLPACHLSVFYGNSKWRPIYIERDVDYVAQLMERERLFWEHVEQDREPPSMKAIKVNIDPDKRKDYDMTGNNMFADLAKTWLDTRDAAQLNKTTEAAIKSLTPTDARSVEGYGIKITVAKNGSQSLRKKEPDNE